MKPDTTSEADDMRSGPPRRSAPRSRRGPPPTRPGRRPREPVLRPITFCVSCQEAIPLRAHTCFRCGAKQPHAEEPFPVIFCERCGRDYLARAMACHHCGHVNRRHPLVRGLAARSR